jgi:myo-inositol 2-dehydrogenase/D-chiro-inositol 1-dehydrogenase
MNSLAPRRAVLKTAAALATATMVPPVLFAAPQGVVKSRSAVERPGIGAIGLRYQGTVITEKAREYGDIVALCDVDRHVREQARASFGSTPAIFEDYQELLQRKDVDVVLIGTPDHWHAKMLIDACRAGKDVYCEKPLTLTIDEGKQVLKAAGQSQQIVQVGSWQRSDHRFRLAVEMVRSGRIGTLKTVDVVLGKNVTGGPFAAAPVPKHFNWNLWQGQTPDVPYIPERTHYTFRWWLEYSGGQMTDWGAHHVDIAHWAINSQPAQISGTGRAASVSDGYNVPIDFSAAIRYENGVELNIGDTGRNGILFTGTEGRLFVNRGLISGTPVDELANTPFPRDQFTVYDFDNPARPERSGKLDAIINHMGNFFDCIESRRRPISSLEDQHRSISVCHLANIALQCQETLSWDASLEQFVDHEEANRKLSRPQRSGFEVL